MKMSKLSNQTNSQDPQAVNSRLFVGNLNTFQCSKTDVERMFQKYGRLVGISMHKGYAFVQFTNPFDARNACHGEDGRTVLSQILDVNMVAEPKPHQTGRKRQNLSKTGNDWDYYYDSYYASTLFEQPTPPPRALGKRQRMMGAQQNRTSPVPNKILNTNVMCSSLPPQHMLQQQPQQQHLQQQIVLASSIQNGNSLLQNGNCNGVLNGEQNYTINSIINTVQATNGGGIQPNLIGPFKVYSNPDTLICGNCKECFTELNELLDHKKSYCKLRFICKCQLNGDNTNTTTINGTQQISPKLLCVVCKDPFKSPWDLMVHAQAAHMINIYELGSQNDAESKDENGNGIHKDNEINGIMETNGEESNENDIKDDNSSIHDDHSITSNVHSSNENLLFEDQLSSSPTPSNDENKHNGNGFIVRDTMDVVDSCTRNDRNCIMRALSIDTIPSPQNVVTSLSVVTNTIGIPIANGGSFASRD